jgi:hypothetical protein
MNNFDQNLDKPIQYEPRDRTEPSQKTLTLKVSQYNDGKKLLDDAIDIYIDMFNNIKFD